MDSTVFHTPGSAEFNSQKHRLHCTDVPVCICLNPSQAPSTPHSRKSLLIHSLFVLCPSPARGTQWLQINSESIIISVSSQGLLPPPSVGQQYWWWPLGVTHTARALTTEPHLQPQHSSTLYVCGGGECIHVCRVHM